MIIACPSCATQYRVDAAVFPSEGRRVKCANCGNRWHAIGELDVAAIVGADQQDTDPPAQDPPAAADRPVSEDDDAIHGEDAADELPDDLSVPDDFAGTDEVDSAGEPASAAQPAADREAGSIIARDPSETLRRAGQPAAIADDLEAGAQFVAEGDEEFDAMAAELAGHAPGPVRPRRRRPTSPSNAWRKRLKRRSMAGGQPASPADRAKAIAIGAMLCGLVLMGINRESVVDAAPHMAALFSAIGMPVNTRGIEFVAVRADFATENGIPVMRVAGRMKNVDGSGRRLSSIRMALLDDSGREIYHWTTDAGQPALEAGGDLAFQSILTSPPDGASSVQVRFADAG